MSTCVSSLASLGSIDDNSLAVGTLLGSLSVVSPGETKDCMSREMLTQCRRLRLLSRPIHQSAWYPAVCTRSASWDLLVVPLLSFRQQRAQRTDRSTHGLIALVDLLVKGQNNRSKPARLWAFVRKSWRCNQHMSYRHLVTKELNPPTYRMGQLSIEFLIQRWRYIGFNHIRQIKISSPNPMIF